REWIARHDGVFGHFVGGRWVKAAEHFDVIDPSTGKRLARVAQGTREDVDAAVAAAHEAQAAWGALPGHARARHLYALARMVQKHSRLFAVLESLDNGKPIRESRDIDIPLVARHFYHHAGWAQLMETDPELRGCAPVGVVGQIIPWNFPLLMLSWKIAPALAMGNTLVLKPAEFTSLTAILFAEICAEAGLPPGVVNIVTGDGRTGALIVEHPDVDKVAFTGSTDVGRIIRVATAGSGKKLSLELGGKSPFIVFDDADLDSVVEGVVDAIWFNQGQVCCAGSRILAQEGIAARLTEKLRARMETLRVGDPLDKAVDIGAIVAPVQLQKIQELVRQGVDEGATMWQPSWSCPQEGCFFPPTLFTDVSPSSTIAQVEIFGPVVVSMTFRTPSEAVALANNTPYGLAASVWTESINLALDIAPKVKAGTVWINSTNVFDAASGFGGYRESGYGREGGREGLWEYVKPRWEKEDGRGQGTGDRGQPAKRKQAKDTASKGDGPTLPPIDRTAKLYIGGKQARPDGGYSFPVHDPRGRLVGEASLGNRKDVRNAVEAAHKAAGWARQTGHNRAQILYYLAENLAQRGDEFARRIAAMTGDEAGAAAEVGATISRLYTYAAWADKWDGDVHHTPVRMVTIAMKESIGVMGLASPDEAPLLGFVSLVAPAIAVGNTVIAIPSERWPLAATDFYQVLETSDVPGGVVNIVTGKRDELAQTLAAHDDVDSMWYFGGAAGSEVVERLSAGNMKRTWVDYGHARDWADPEQGEGPEFLRQATHVKNIWVPYGE
ncbi:MAG TPA: aldehyde dehydrogenase family protein, partial [Longimicrobiaceae bacterium]|nr:aldehyde dehydrogenase family protein [Longimicrobiaceae bacterium]